MNKQQLHINKLVERCKNNDTAAQMELYKSYYKAMYNTSFRILKDEFEAEDIMQEAFLTAFTKIHTFRAEVVFGAWLKRIVVNKSLTQLKKTNRYHEVKLEVVADPIEDNERIDIRYTRLDKTDVLNCINELKDNYRIILTLSLIEGYDNEEIAQILNYSNENVRTTISRAKKKLKQLLQLNIKTSKVYGRR